MSQFGGNMAALEAIRAHFGGPVRADQRLLGVFDWQVVAAGLCGGVARGCVETPFEFVKVRRQARFCNCTFLIHAAPHPVCLPFLVTIIL